MKAAEVRAFLVAHGLAARRDLGQPQRGRKAGVAAADDGDVGPDRPPQGLGCRRWGRGRLPQTVRLGIPLHA